MSITVFYFSYINDAFIFKNHFFTTDYKQQVNKLDQNCEHDNC